MVTGDEYEATLGDCRTIYFQGERVTGLLGHPHPRSVMLDVAAGTTGCPDTPLDMDAARTSRSGRRGIGTTPNKECS